MHAQRQGGWASNLAAFCACGFAASACLGGPEARPASAAGDGKALGYTTNLVLSGHPTWPVHSDLLCFTILVCAWEATGLLCPLHFSGVEGVQSFPKTTMPRKTPVCMGRMGHNTVQALAPQSSKVVSSNSLQTPCPLCQN